MQRSLKVFCGRKTHHLILEAGINQSATTEAFVVRRKEASNKGKSQCCARS